MVGGTLNDALSRARARTWAAMRSRMSTRTAKPSNTANPTDSMASPCTGKGDRSTVRPGGGSGCGRPWKMRSRRVRASLAAGLSRSGTIDVMLAEPDAQPRQRPAVGLGQVADQAVGLGPPHGALLLDQAVGDAAAGAGEAVAARGLAQAGQGAQPRADPAVEPAAEPAAHPVLDAGVEGRIELELQPRRQHGRARPQPGHDRTLPAQRVVVGQRQGIVGGGDELARPAAQHRQRRAPRRGGQQPAVGIEPGLDDGRG